MTVTIHEEDLQVVAEIKAELQKYDVKFISPKVVVVNNPDYKLKGFLCNYMVEFE